MYKTSQETQDRKDAKRQYILDTAAAVFARNGYHNTSVKDIVDEAKISVGSFYFYFKSKEELFAELYQSITKEFQASAESVLDTKRFSMSKNFTRVTMSDLWMYQQHRDLAKIMLIEAAAVNPEFKKMRDESIEESSRTMEMWFRRFKEIAPVNIPDEKTAALIFEGSFYYLINDWLENGKPQKLTDLGFALCVYHLQALRIPFEEKDVKQYIDEVLCELSGVPGAEKG